MPAITCAICGNELELNAAQSVEPCRHCNPPAPVENSPRPGQSIGTQPNLLLASGLAAVTGAAFYFAGPLTTLRETPLYSLFCAHGWVPYVSTFLFGVAAWILLLKIPLINREWSAFSLQLLPTDGESLLDAALVNKVLARIERLSDRQRRFFLINRIRQSLLRLTKLGKSEMLDDILRYRAEADTLLMESSYAAPKFIIWAIPVLGFVGTVIGISRGVSGFSTLIQSAGNLDELRLKLTEVTGGLGQAFETTMVALCMSLVLMLLMSYLQKREDQLLGAVEEYCMENLLHRVSGEEDRTNAEMLAVMTSLLVSVQRMERLSPPAESAVSPSKSPTPPPAR